MKKKIIDVFLMALLFTVTVGTVVSCKDYEEDNYADLKGNLTTVSDELRDRVKTLEDARTLLEQEVTNLRTELGTAEDDATKTTIYGRLASAEAALELINGRIDKINESLINKQDSIDKLYEYLYGVSGEGGALSDLAGKISSNTELIEKLNQLIYKEDGTYAWSEAIEDAAAALTLAQYDSARVDKLEEVLGDDYTEFREAVASALRDAEGNWKDLSDVLDEYRNEIVGTYDGTLSDLSEDFTKKIEDLTRRIGDLETKTDAIDNRVGMLENLLNKLVTGVIIQGTKNPVYGTFSLPFGISSNVLAAYYGNMEDMTGDLHFPIDDGTLYKASYVYSKDGTSTALTKEDLQMLGVEANTETVESANHKYLVLDKTGNAGTLYLTVNPTNADLSGASAHLENSAGYVSKVTLSGIEKTQDLLSFGIGTRSEQNVNNGFYKTLATVDELAIDDVKPRVSYDDLKDIYTSAKDIVSDIVNNKSVSGIDIKPLLTTLYNVSTDILDANAVNFSWTTKDEEGNDVKNSVFSKYELAATAIKPLSYNTWINANYDRLPGIGHVENIIGGIFDKVKDALPTFDIDDVDIEIGKIEISDVSVGEITTIVHVNATDNYGNPVHVDPIKIDITEQVQNAFDQAMGGIQGDLDAFVEDLQGQIDQINDLIAQLKQINDLGSSIDDIENQIYDYLYRGEDLALRFINNANKLLQPVVLVKTSNSFLTLSSSKGAPTRFSASSAANGISLYPTSYTLEVLAPAYKKLVGVTNVYDKNGNSAQGGNIACVTELNRVNGQSENFCKIIDGDIRSAKLVDAQKGYIYEIAYSAVDYSGKVVAKKYYIELD